MAGSAAQSPHSPVENTRPKGSYRMPTMNKKRWLNLVGRILLSLALLYCIYLVATRAIALWYFRQADLAGVRKAIEWDPGNPRYYAALARVLERSIEGEDLEETIERRCVETRLN